MTVKNRKVNSKPFSMEVNGLAVKRRPARPYVYYVYIARRRRRRLLTTVVRLPAAHK